MHIGFVNIESPQALVSPQSPHYLGFSSIQIILVFAGPDPLHSEVLLRVVVCCVEMLCDWLVEVVSDC